MVLISECTYYIQLLFTHCRMYGDWNVSRLKTFACTFVKISRVFQKKKIHSFGLKIGFQPIIQYSHTLQEMSKTLKYVKGKILSGIQKFCQNFFSHIFWILKIDLKIKWNPNNCRRKKWTKFLKSPYRKTQLYKSVCLFDLYCLCKLVSRRDSVKHPVWISYS